MQFQDVAKILKDIAHMQPRKGEQLYDSVKNSGLQNILELDFAHGTSTYYMTATLNEKGKGISSLNIGPFKICWKKS